LVDVHYAVDHIWFEARGQGLCPSRYNRRKLGDTSRT
jgi:hypothetical protein